MCIRDRLVIMIKEILPMLNLKLPDQYDTGMSIRETEVAIKLIKDFFERELSETLALTRVRCV